MRIVASTNRRAVAGLLSATRIRDRATETRAAAIVDRVRKGGDEALMKYARDLDGLAGTIEVPRRVWEAQARTLAPGVRVAIKRAAANIRTVAQGAGAARLAQTVGAGISVEQRVIPLARVGCYVPAGRYPLPSSLLMTAIPARAAGVPEVIVACPRPDAAVFAAALEAGVDRVFQVGGAHAIAAMAYGTRTVPRVDKIVGPGNRWVSAAKSLVSSDCGIDFYAGPTEILIVAASGPAAAIAADLIAQAEHDPGCAGGIHHLEPAAGRTGIARGDGADAGERPGPAIARAARRHHPVPRTWTKRWRSPTTPRSNISSWELKPWPSAYGMLAPSSSARGRRRSPATTPSARTTCCRPPAPRAIAAA